MSAQLEIRFAYLMGQLGHTESIVSKQDIIAGLLAHEGSPTAAADELLARMHHSLQQTRQNIRDLEVSWPK
ncbi:hypothetical protein NKH52_06850 [Mesorhizobium sp. M1066]|uniref:hypothetical protein n=1 Tax=unclassified Mesorhizobium TaxID=325217 RepID=UPI000FC9B084|nr:hypothetical protein [Mesorhizobium sp. M7A.F.Ca.US.011.01.1.1]RUX23765.1 hypothetical protein EOA13_32930 [Mesorhizobium sp. M7A.F.Ca.US.011.01.1.1]